MRIVVIGATGNVGSAFVRLLASRDDVDIVGVARRRPSFDPPFSQVDFHELDVADPANIPRLTAIVERADAVVHAAWALQPNRDEAAMARVNIGGLANVLAAVRAAGTPQLVVMSSVGAYSPGPKRRRVDEDWPTGGIHTSHYARHKAACERLLDRFEASGSATRVARVRPGLVMQSDAGSEIAALFLGPLIPTAWMNSGRLPLLPLPSRLISQVVHADDLADALWRIVSQKAEGAFNIAAEPVIGPEHLAAAFGARWLRIRLPVFRALAAVAWRARIVATDPGWIDLAASIPIMNTDRATTELGWSPNVRATDAVAELIDGIAEHRSLGSSPQLRRGGVQTAIELTRNVAE